MAKKRTGLQSDISSIFSGVPVPKKDSPPPKTPAKPGTPQPPASPEEPVDVKPQQTTPPPVSPAKPAGVEPQQPQKSAPPPVEPKPAPVPKPESKPEVSKPSVVAEPKKEPAVPAVPKVLETRKPEPKVQQIPTRVPQRRKDRFTTTKSGVSARRQKASIVMVVVLSIALVFLLGRPYLNSRNNPPIANTANQENTGLKPADIEIDWPDPPVYLSYYRDPMDPESNGRAVPKTTQEIVVSGIVYSEDNARAIIDGIYYGVGDSVKGATISNIERNSVTFEKNSKTWTQGVQEGER